MGLSAWVGNSRYEIGDAAFLKAWFSTILARLEAERWGQSYPTIMRDLYGGRLNYKNAAAALNELEDIRGRLSALAPDQLVWDFEARRSRPPWGDNISPQITSLANYFVTSDGKDLFDVLTAALSESAARGEDVTIG